VIRAIFSLYRIIVIPGILYVFLVNDHWRMTPVVWLIVAVWLLAIYSWVKRIQQIRNRVQRRRFPKLF
jgi:ABC-type multidrug transport system fused ATPase/permease subunit